MTEYSKSRLRTGGLSAALGIFFAVAGVWCGINVNINGYIMAAVGGLFAVVGIGVVISSFSSRKDKKILEEKGRKYTGKIYSYVESHGIMVNDAYPVNIKVRFFDEKNIKREVLIPTEFIKGSGEFPIGATIDIIIGGGKASWVKDSVRFETLENEEELMDNKPLNAEEIEEVEVCCPKCGGAFKATRGYVYVCPYCGGSTDN